ncbi:MAG TPA: CPBP family intramembrane glutamic endopeptidase [Cellvibrio sp.]|nr:CPBP family intramembrane glutamic endopeptidase [Cellvibrio sp.]
MSNNPLFRLHPNRILSALDTIDAAAPSYTMNRPQALRRVVAVMACVSVCLLLDHYGKFSDNLLQFLQLIARWSNLSENDYVNQLAASHWYELCAYAWWTGVHLLSYVILPGLCIRFVFRERIRDFGWQFNQTAQHWRGYLLLLSPILVFVYLVSLGQDFVDHYPFYSLTGRSWADLLAWEFLYLCQFVFLEFFFRGFMLNALRPAIGANAVWVMCVPYLMIHFPKLWLEATGAILFGLFLGILALQSRSIWGGVLVHAGVAVSMDMAALLRKQGLPDNFWPL